MHTSHLKLLAAAFFLLIMPILACGGTASQSPETEKAMTLHCPECAESGMAANVWRSEQMAERVCTLDWGTTVSVMETSSVNGGMAHIRAGECEG